MVGVTGPAVAGNPVADRVSRPRTLEEYRHFRSLSIDLRGRFPSREELARFEDPRFDMGTWVEDALRSEGYVDRMTRIYMDALRLDVNPLVQFTPAPAMLYAETIKDERGKLQRVFYRRGQRRLRDATDGDFCLSPEESGVDTTKPRGDGSGLPMVTQSQLDKTTVLVRPWWMYRDYRASKPSERIGREWQSSRYFQPVKDLLVERDGTTELTEVRVCREEAQTAESGHLWVSNRPANKISTPVGRISRYPFDDAYARTHKGESVGCSSQIALNDAPDCGCGIGLERCMPNPIDYALTFTLPMRELVGLDGALPSGGQQLSSYFRWWWREEVERFFDTVFSQDRDVREIVTGRYTHVNGALSQFYRHIEPAACCSHERSLGMLAETDPLFSPALVPALLPHEVDVWTFVPDRGKHAAGILTTAAFLQKFASRRARAAAAYTGLLCKNFMADTSSAAPSTSPNLMERPGCSSCHQVLEPMSAYFSRVKEGSMTFLTMPTVDPQCRLRKGKTYGYCPDFYDPAFSDEKVGVMRGAYASHAFAEAGPEGLGAALAANPDYVRCAVEQVTSSFLGRALTPDDDALRTKLLAGFVESGHRMRALVRTLLLDPAYAEARLGPRTSVANATSGFIHPPIPEAATR